LALADLNFGGFPETIQLNQMQSNAAGFANMLTNHMKNKTMLGLGSVEGSDSNDNGRGICDNHAYAILQVRTYND